MDREKLADIIYKNSQHFFRDKRLDIADQILAELEKEKPTQEYCRCESENCIPALYCDTCHNKMMSASGKPQLKKIKKLPDNMYVSMNLSKIMFNKINELIQEFNKGKE